MSLEVRPLGVRCNLGCQYCYQNAERDVGGVPARYDLEALIERLRQADEPFTLFGGETLLVPLGDLEALFALGHERFGRNTIQTNGTLISEAHLDLFACYEVEVGVSIDGPGELNDARWAGSLERTREMTRRSEAAIEALLDRGIPTSLIVTLHRNNATVDKLVAMTAWLRRLDRLGVESARLHLLEVDDPEVGAKYALDPAGNLAALLAFEALEPELTSMRLDVFSEMRKLLEGRDEEASCAWRACDPWTTEAVQGLDGNGQQSNCGRTNKEGVGFVKAPATSYERTLALFHTPQAYGGCRDCRFFLMCKGQCPGTAIDGDWRNRSADCATWKELFLHLEARLRDEGRVPLSLHPLRAQVESLMLDAWSKGNNPPLAKALSMAVGTLAARSRRAAPPAALETPDA